MMTKLRLRIVLTGSILLAAGGLLFSGVAYPANPGSSLAGIDTGETQSFLQGKVAFMQVLEPEDGLGPAFNATSCAGCHNVPAVGGSGNATVMRAGQRDADGNFHVLLGSTLFPLSSTPDYRCQVQIPPEANVIARRISGALFGLGLIEAIPDETLLAIEDPYDLNQDGIRGRAAIITDVASGLQKVGRFGWKAQHASLLGFAADAYRSEIGITNELFPDELAPGVDPQQLKLCDLIPGIEDVRDRKTGLRTIDKLASFLKYLAPLDRGAINDSVLAGESLFAWSGCTACHIPVLTTGPSSNAVFDRKPVPLYSDLLLHDLNAGDGIEQGAAKGSEMRTTPLWGLRFRRPLWHDGSLPDSHAAILRHGGAGKVAKQRYLSLSAEQQAQVIAFLGSL